MGATDTHVVVLAAGQGTRMRSVRPKVLHSVGGRPMLDWALAAAQTLDPRSVTVVVGYAADAIRERLHGQSGLSLVIQEPQRGTADALLQTAPLLDGRTGTLVLLSGDVPLLTPGTLRGLLATHCRAKAAATVVTARFERPVGYGRIVRVGGRIARIVEDRDASPAERRIREINSGIYAFDLAPLFTALRAIASENAQGEYYLTDLITIYRRRRLKLETYQVDNPQEVRGINSRTELAEVSALVRQKKNEELMAAGVTIVDPSATYVDPDVEIGIDTILHPGVIIEGRSRIGSACEIQAHVRIVDSEIGDRVTVKNFSLITRSRIAAGAAVGPFAHLRPESVVGEESKVGNFVELKRTVLGARSKANHLSYLGDTTVGNGVNVGAGTITCNYDGRTKHETVIDDGAFIGSDTQLVAPVRVGREAYVAAGSTITEDVPPRALGIARGRQTNIAGWVDRKKSDPSS
jgi:bifunctional UDP-N-acetylglucosamine pyrophosphorylase/glucosamine-1-phosphate N-acetyltransferase